MEKPTKHIGNLVIDSADKAERYSDLKEITGDLSIYSSAKLDAPALTSVGGDLSINSSAKLDALTSVGGDLSINSSAKLDALTSVGGDLSINSSAKLDAPALTSVGGYLSIKKDAVLTANKLYTGGYSKFTVLDDIPCVTLSSKQAHGVTVLACRRAQIKNQKVIGDKFYVAQSRGHNAHGKTIEEAVRELQFKTGTRDIEKYRDMPRNTRKSPEEWAFVYRMVTGACKFGTEDFMKRKGALKKSYTLTEILAETKGAYGSDKFREVVGS